MGFDTYGRGPASQNGQHKFGVQESRQDVLNNVVEVASGGGLWQALQSALFIASQSQLPVLVPNGTDQVLFTENINAGFLSKLARVVRVRVWFVYTSPGTPGLVTVKLKYGATTLCTITPRDNFGQNLEPGVPGYIEFTVNISSVPTNSTINVNAQGRLELNLDVVSISEAAFVYLTNGTVSNGVSINTTQALAVTFNASVNTANPVQGTLAMIEVLN